MNILQATFRDFWLEFIYVEIVVFDYYVDDLVDIIDITMINFHISWTFWNQYNQIILSTI